MAQIDGPQDYYTTEREPAESQWRLMAELACSMLDVPKPTNRMEASVLIARMKLAVENVDVATPDLPALA